MLRRKVKMVGRAMLVAAAALWVPMIGLAGAPIAGAVSQQTLVGAWSGPSIVGAGDCGIGSAEFAFSPDGTYRYAAMYPNCPAVMLDGRYELQSDGGVLQISMEQCGDPGCPPGPSMLTTSISATDAESIVLGGHYTYLRQHG
jgi:hypothetical protein